jgi:hypothetical protein
VETDQEKQLFFKLLADADSSSFGCAPTRGIAWDSVVSAFNTAVSAAWDAGESRDSLRMKNKPVLVRYYNSFSKDQRLVAAHAYAEQRERAAAASIAATGGTAGTVAAASGLAVAVTDTQTATAMAASSGQQLKGASSGSQQYNAAARRGGQQQGAAGGGQQQQQQQGASRARQGQQTNWLTAAGAQTQPTHNPKGKGLGGKGAPKICVPCSLAADETLQNATAARKRGKVGSSRGHQCPYCKECDECTKVWNSKSAQAVVCREKLAATLKIVAHPEKCN